MIAVYHVERGFGFIHETQADGRLVRYFFHVSWVASGEPRTGLKAQFIPEQNDKGFVAKDVKVIPAAPINGVTWRHGVKTTVGGAQ